MRGGITGSIQDYSTTASYSDKLKHVKALIQDANNHDVSPAKDRFVFNFTSAHGGILNEQGLIPYQINLARDMSNWFRTDFVDFNKYTTNIGWFLFNLDPGSLDANNNICKLIYMENNYVENPMQK